jgi:hypothetical protein
MRQNVQAQEPLGFCEMSIFESVRKWYEDKFNCPRPRMELFLLVRCLKSAARGSFGHSRPRHSLPMMEGIVSIAVLILVILLFGFDSTGPIKTRRQYKQLALKHRSGNFAWL